MANINRPKYQAGGRVSPYQLADIITAPKKTEMEVFFDKLESGRIMQRKKISFDEEFRKELEKLQREAKKKSGKHKGLFKAIDLIGAATGTTPLTSAATGYGRAADYKKAIGGMRLGEDWTGRTKGTFLAPTSRGYQKEIEALRGSINPLEAALMSGLSSLLTQKISGGEFGKSPFKDLFGEKSADVVGEDIFGDMESLEGVGSQDKGGFFKNLHGEDLLSMLPFFENLFGEGTYANVPEIQY